MVSYVFNFLQRLAPRLFSPTIVVPQKSATSKRIEGPVIDEKLVSILNSCSIGKEYSYTSLESAALVLKIAQSLDFRLQNDIHIDDFFTKLEVLERKKLKCVSFGSKCVVSVEGLPKSGKSKLIKSFGRSFERVQIIAQDDFEFINSVRSSFESMPAPVLKAFNFVVNYFIASEIIDRHDDPPDTLYFIESYHLNFLVHNMVETITDEDVMSAMSNSHYFDWILDLPVPLAVLQISIAPELLNDRLRESATGTLDLAWARRFDMAFRMFQGISSIDGNQSPEGVLQQSAEALLNIGIPLTVKAGNPTIYTTDSPRSSLPAVHVHPSSSALLGNSLSPIVAANDSLLPIQLPSGGCLSPMTVNPALPTTPERKRSMRNFRQVSMGVYALWNAGQN